MAAQMVDRLKLQRAMSGSVDSPDGAGSSDGRGNQGPSGDEPANKKMKISLPKERLSKTFVPRELGLREDFSLIEFSELKARKSKIPVEVIDKMLKSCQNQNTDPNEGSEGISMDASITQLKTGLCLIQTSNHFYPTLEDPYLQGHLACATILSDLYALGVHDVDTMLMNLSVSHKLGPKERDVVIPLMMKGFRDCASAAKTRITGGETALNPWCMIGGVASSVCDVNDYILPDQAIAGDVLVLTKPLGTQIAVQCYEWCRTNNQHWQKLNLTLNGTDVEKAYHRAVDSMTRLNVGAAILMHKYKAHGATSIGGFGLLGHAMALARCQKAQVSFIIHNLPVISKMAAVAKAKMNIFPLSQGICCEMGGGLLICLPREQAASFCKEIEAQYSSQSWIIGIVEKGDRTARIIEKPRIIEVPAKDKTDSLW